MRLRIPPVFERERKAEINDALIMLLVVGDEWPMINDRYRRNEWVEIADILTCSAQCRQNSAGEDYWFHAGSP